MSIVNGPISSTNESYGDATTDTSGFLLSTKGSTIRIVSPKTIPSSDEDGEQGEICWDSNYVYFCVGFGAWKRIALQNFE